MILGSLDFLTLSLLWRIGGQFFVKYLHVGKLLLLTFLHILLNFRSEKVTPLKTEYYATFKPSSVICMNGLQTDFFYLYKICFVYAILS